MILCFLFVSCIDLNQSQWLAGSRGAVLIRTDGSNINNMSMGEGGGLSQSLGTQSVMSVINPTELVSARPAVTFQLQRITVFCPLSNDIAWWQRHIGVNKLPRVVKWLWNGRQSNLWALNHASDVLIIILSHSIVAWRKEAVCVQQSRSFFYQARSQLT